MQIFNFLFVKWGKNWSKPKTHIQKSQLGIKILCPNLSSTVENKGNLHKIKLVAFQT